MNTPSLISHPLPVKGLDLSCFEEGADLACAWCVLPMLPLRAAPSERAEQVTQVLHGQCLCLRERRADWLRLTVMDDGYEGWCTAQMITEVAVDTVRAFFEAPRVLTMSPLSRCRTVNGGAYLPAGSRLLPGEQVIDACVHPTPVTPVQAVLDFLQVPYLWGGKTVLGVDCSGLVQLAYALCGRLLPRDASQQALLGNPVDDLGSVTEGDLAFFQNDEGRVVHVGLLLDERRILHASGWVRVDRWDTQGIYDDLRGVYSHRFQQVRRCIL